MHPIQYKLLPGNDTAISLCYGCNPGQLYDSGLSINVAPENSKFGTRDRGLIVVFFRGFFLLFFSHSVI
jgi:hypothetical protein